MDNFRIVSFNRDTLSLKAISYHKTVNKALKELTRMVNAGECEEHLMYYIQEYKEAPVKTPEDREKFLKSISKEIKN